MTNLCEDDPDFSYGDALADEQYYEAQREAIYRAIAAMRAEMEKEEKAAKQ
jgi:hypothetical protein